MIVVVFLPYLVKQLCFPCSFKNVRPVVQYESNYGVFMMSMLYKHVQKNIHIDTRVSM